MEIEKKVIVITGASRGLGRALALRLSHLGATLILVARHESELTALKRRIEKQAGKSPLVVACDITDEQGVVDLAEKVAGAHGRVDVLVNNAGVGIFKPSCATGNDEMRAQFEVNVFGAFYCIRALLPLLRQSGEGYILNVGSLLSEIVLANTGVYSASKRALSALSDGLAEELERDGIKVGVFLPGPMNTGFHDHGEPGAIQTPRVLILNPDTAALKIQKMIQKRERKRYSSRTILWLLVVKRFVSSPP